MHANPDPRFLKLVALVAVVGCGGGDPTTPPRPLPPLPPPTKLEAPAPTPVWETTYGVDLKFRDPAFASVRCSHRLQILPKTETLAFDIHCAGTPKVEIAIEGFPRIVEPSSDLYNHFGGDILARLGGVPLATFVEQHNVKFVIPTKVTYHFAGYQPLVLEPPMWWVDTTSFRAWSHGVHFAATEPADDGELAALAVDEYFSGHQLIGKGTTLADLDWIVVKREAKDAPRRNCPLGLSIILESIVTIYDRRTGAVVDETTIKKPDAPCQERGVFVMGQSEKRAAVQPGDVKKYVEAQIAARKPKK